MSGDGVRTPQDWFLLLSQAKKTCVASRLGLKRIHYKMMDGQEMVEEWKVSGVLDGGSNNGVRDLLGRYLKKRTIVGKEMSWETEIGESLDNQVIQCVDDDNDIEVTSPHKHQPLLIKESNSNPMVSSRSTLTFYEWRIRNLPPPADNYLVSPSSSSSSSCESPSDSALIVSTKSRKYYKKLIIPDMIRLGLPLQSKSISTSFANRTLVIQYKKPRQVLELEAKIWKEIISPLHEEKSQNTNGPPGCVYVYKEGRLS